MWLSLEFSPTSLHEHERGVETGWRLEVRGVLSGWNSNQKLMAEKLLECHEEGTWSLC